MKLVVALHSFLGGCVVPGLSGDRLQSISIGCLEDMWDTNPQLTLTAPKRCISWKFRAGYKAGGGPPKLSSASWEAMLCGDSPQSIFIGCLGDANPQFTGAAPKINVFPRNLGQVTKLVVVLQTFQQLLGKPSCARAERGKIPEHLHRVFGVHGGIQTLTCTTLKLNIFPRNLVLLKDLSSLVWSSLPISFCRPLASWQRDFGRSATPCRRWAPICG